MSIRPYELVAIMVLCVASCAAVSAQPSEGEVLTQQLRQEITAGLARRQIAQKFDRFSAYTAERLDASAGERTFSDKTGNCRLAWFDHLLRHPVESITEGEQFTRLLHEAACHEQAGLRELLAMAAVRLDAGELSAPSSGPSAAATQDPLDVLAESVAEAHASLDRAFAPLTDQERQELRGTLYEQSTGNALLGHRFADPEKSRRACDLLEKLDRHALIEAGYAVAGLADPAFLRQLDGTADQEVPGMDGVTGALVGRIKTDRGLIIVGGRGPNEYDLDLMGNVCAVVDLGGSDVYREGTLSPNRPVLAVIDLAGDDTYQGEKPGIQGGAVLGVSFLLDRSGNDKYRAGDVAQGSCLGGVGILIDPAGDDTYQGDRRVQGQAVGGVGILIDRSGDDSYHAALLAQGVGGPLGFGLLDDLAGADHYYAGGKYPGGYDDSPGYGSWSQGVGVGPRGVANGGIGVILDGGGDDVYEYDYFGHGGGYWFAVGFARDFAGNDQRIGSTRTEYDGSPRREAPFVRWGVGYGCHYALGFIFDDAGNDTYCGDSAVVGYAWDIAVGVICDFKGNDRYESLAGGQALSRNAALAIVFDGQGDDVYAGSNTAFASPTVDYHPVAKAGGNFSFLIDYGGQDTYEQGLENNTEQERGWAGGFFIDRPAAPTEAELRPGKAE